MSLLRRPDGDNIAKMYGKYMTSAEFELLIENQEVNVLCQNGLLTAIVLGFDNITGVGSLCISKTSEVYTGSFELLYVAHPRKLIRKSLTCPEPSVAVVTAEKKPKLDTEVFSPFFNVSFSMNAVSPDAITPRFTCEEPSQSNLCVICNSDLDGLSALEKEVHISSCLDCSVCVDLNDGGGVNESIADTLEDTEVNWSEYDKQSINDEDCCLICSENLAALTEIERNQHMLKCCLALQEIENGAEQTESNQANEEKYLFLTQPQPPEVHHPPTATNAYFPSSSSSSYSSSSYSYSAAARDVGVPTVSYCTSKASFAGPPIPVNLSKPSAPPVAPVVEEERGFMCKVFYCVICDLDLSKKQLSSRFQHMKQCAKAHHIDTKVLMSMIAPEEAGGSLLDLEAEEQREEERARQDWRFMMNKPGQFRPPIPQSSGAASRASAVIVVEGGEEGLVPIGAGLDKKGSRRKSTGKKGDVGTTAAGTEETASAVTTSTVKSSKTAFSSSNSSSKKGYWGSWKKSSDKPNTGYAPAYKKIQIGGMSVPIVVDGFQYACPQLSSCYFLTHFHSDHYMGLEKDFNAGTFLVKEVNVGSRFNSACVLGTIYCSATTAALVQMKLRVDAAHLVCLDLEKRVGSFPRTILHYLLMLLSST